MPATKGLIFIGTSGWNYPHWKAPFYQGAPAKKFLELYSQHFDSVEVNKSFYRLLKIPETTRWYDQTADNFLFAMKGSRFITHMLKLKKPKRALGRFFRPLKPLKEKLGPILFQLPPYWNVNMERLTEFLDALPADHHYAFELRDPRWITDEVLEEFKKRQIAFCIYDFDGRCTPRHVTARFAYVRLHGPGARYRDSYSEEQLKDWASWISAQQKKGIDVYCYFDNDQKAYAAQNAATLKQLLQNNHLPRLLSVGGFQNQRVTA